MINILAVMQELTQRYQHLGEIRIHATTDTQMYTAQIKAHPHAKGTINNVFHFEPTVTEAEFMEKVRATCRNIDLIAKELNAVFESPHDPHAG